MGVVPDAERQAKRMQALAESSHLFAEASPNLERLLGVIARRFSELVGEASNIRLIEGDSLVPVATYHPDRQIDGYLHEFHDATPLKVGTGISGHVISTGEPYFEPELDLEAFEKRVAPAFVPIFRKIGIRGMIVVRLRARGINLGYLALFRIGDSRPPYSQHDLHLVQDLADRAALAIDNSRLVDDLERRVAQRTEALEAANRELEAFAYSVSHDLRAPLRAIDGFSAILEEDHGPKLDEEGRHTLGSIRRNAQRMSQLIEGLLRLSRLGHGALQPIAEIDMSEIVETTLRSLRSANASLTIEATVGELPRAIGNSDLLRQVWINLLENAVKYSRKRPVITIEVAGKREGHELHYTVVDHGAGFDPKYAAKLFGVFQRLHGENEFEGTGVGLALVKRIVSRHGGRVWAIGQIDAGATFGFALPERGPPLRDDPR